MPFSTEITNIKAEINSGLSASQYTAKDLVYVSKAIEALANAEGSAGIFDEATVNTILYVGANANNFEDTGSLTDPIAIFSKAGGASSFAQIAFRNETATSSTDIIAYMNNGDDSEGWVGMGITGSAFDDATYGITGPGDGYIFHNTKPGTGRKGNLVLATGDAGEDNKIIFAAGGFASGDTQMEITPGVNVHIEIPTASTSPSTGALTVVGGVGIQGDINIAGNVTFGGAGTSLETSTLAVSDPLIFVGNGNITDAVDLGLVAEYANSVSTITKAVSNKALTSNVATLTTSTTHGFAVGDIVVVGSVDATFNGTYVVKAVPTTTTFTYDKTASNVTSAAVSPAGTAEVSSQRRFAGTTRDASDGVIKFFKDATTKPTSTINFSEAGLSYADIKIAALDASSATIGNVSNTELQYLDGVTSAIQTQLNAKAPLASPTFTGTVTLPSDTSIGTVSATELGYVDGVTSSIQTQLDNKLSTATASSTYAALSGAAFTGNVQLQEISEVVVDVTLSSNVGTLDWAAGNVFYIATAPSAAMTFNVTNVPTTTSRIMTINVFVTQGSTGYIPSTFQIGGASQTIKWANGGAPTPTSSAGKIDIFSFTMQRTSGGAWLVYGAASLNF
jgi:hypothetical protein